MEKLYSNKNVGVVITDAPDSGWSTVNPHISRQLLFDKELVEMVLSNTNYNIIVEYCESKYGIGNYIPGVFHLRVVYVPVGTFFQVERLRNGEILVKMNPEDMYIA